MQKFFTQSRLNFHNVYILNLLFPCGPSWWPPWRSDHHVITSFCQSQCYPFIPFHNSPSTHHSFAIYQYIHQYIICILSVYFHSICTIPSFPPHLYFFFPCVSIPLLLYIIYRATLSYCHSKIHVKSLPILQTSFYVIISHH